VEEVAVRTGSKLAGLVLVAGLIVGVGGVLGVGGTAVAGASWHSKAQVDAHATGDKKKKDKSSKSSTKKKDKSSKSSTKKADASKGVSVKTSSSSKYGTILVTNSGMTLYMLTADSPTKSVCTQGCPLIWPPLTTKAAPKAGHGVQAKHLATIARSAGVHQVTYDGHPLYTYSGDSSPGQVNGEGIDAFGGHWYVLSSSGKPVTKSASSSKKSNGSKSSGGYGGY